jgi:hypothetical protein
MQSINVEILNPEAQKLLIDMVDLQLIRIKRQTSRKQRQRETDSANTHLASEYTLAKVWSTPSEDEAWKDL